MYSHGYTRKSGPLREVLAQAKVPQGQDWALAWTEEELLPDRMVELRAGWFSTMEQEIFALDPMAGGMPDMGVTRSSRSITLP